MKRKYLEDDHLPPSGFGYFVWQDENGDVWHLLGSAKNLPKGAYDKWRQQNLLPLFKKHNIA